MSSSYAVHSSSPFDSLGRRSKFTFRQLSQLTSYTTTCPLRVIALIDLDAFYAQCEMVRLGVGEDVPLAVQQWQGLIAINYPAREFGIGRHSKITEAMEQCPTLIAQHVATWREGDDKWAYRDDAAANIATDKVSLDPYRLQSRKILALIKECLPPHLQKVEKASIDEVFIDLSALVHSILLDRFTELSLPPPHGDPQERLPLPSIAALDWQADALIDLAEDAGEIEDPDWDDVAMLVGSEIVRDLRLRIRQDLGYTCSAGIACNKMLSKLGSAHKKPNQQTVIRNRAVGQFLSGMKFTKIRNLGGKLGDQVVATFKTDLVEELLAVRLDQFKSKLGEDTGIWVYNTIRGVDTSEVNARTAIKSMLSAKSFRPTIHSFEQAVKWLRIFAADIFARLVEEGLLENKRRPRTINLHHRHVGQTRSRQQPIPQGKPLDEEGLFDLSRNLLSQIISEGQVWPCANLSLSVTGFEDGVRGNLGIGSFLLKGEEALALRGSPQGFSEVGQPPQGKVPPEKGPKRRRLEGGGIQRFFARKLSTEDGNDSGNVGKGGEAIRLPSHEADGDHASSMIGDTAEALEDPVPRRYPNDSDEAVTAQLTCSRCNLEINSPIDLQSHEDWHLATELQEAERVSQAFDDAPVVPRKSAAKGPVASSKRSSRGGKLESGQSKLKFA